VSETSPRGIRDWSSRAPRRLGVQLESPPEIFCYRATAAGWGRYLASARSARSVTILSGRSGDLTTGPRFIWCLLTHATDCRSPRTAFGCTAHPHQRVDQIVDWLPLLRHGLSIAGRARRCNGGYLARLTRNGSLPRVLAKEVCDIAGSLIGRQERDDRLSQSAALASKPAPHLHQWEIFPEMCAQFHQREPSGMLARATICAVVIRIVDMGERGGVELGVFHCATLPAVGCGHPWDNSYR
jgi:hypothetical protein